MAPRFPPPRPVTGVHRSSIPGIRHALGNLGAIVADVDRELRYVWIDNPHPDFRADAVIGRRDDELISGEDAHEIMAVKRKAFELERPVSRVLMFHRSDGVRYFSFFAYPILEDNGTVKSILTVGFDTLPDQAAS
jgi:hypothetical protein